jgi:hypothetical protein
MEKEVPADAVHCMAKKSESLGSHAPPYVAAFETEACAIISTVHSITTPNNILLPFITYYLLKFVFKDFPKRHIFLPLWIKP